MARPGLGTPLDDATLARCQQLPDRPADMTLTGQRVQLRPLDLGREWPAVRGHLEQPRTRP